MKKVLLFLLATLFTLPLMQTVVPASASSVLTVGLNYGEYDTIKDAVDAAADGDTIKLLEDTEKTLQPCTISKSVTIDTNGFVWYGGSSASPNKKAVSAVISSNAQVVITNSKRTERVTGTETVFDLEGFGPNNQNGSSGGMFRITNTSKLTLENITAKNTNSYSGNRSAVVSFDSTAACVVINNCYLTSKASAAIVVDNTYAINLSASNSIIKGANSGIMFINTNSDSVASTINLDGCQLGVLAATDTGNTDNVDTSTDTFENVTMNVKNSDTEIIYPKNMTVVYEGVSSSTSVVPTILVNAVEGTSLYSDADFTTAVNKNSVLEAATPIYTQAAEAKYAVTLDGENVATVTDGDEYTLQASAQAGFISYKIDGEYYNAGDKITVNRNLIITTVAIGEVSMCYGAAMRLREKSGIRFYTSVDIEKIKALYDNGASISMGTLIAPQNLLGGEELTLDVDISKRLDIQYWIGLSDNSWFEGNIGDASFKGMVGSIVNIKKTVGETKGNENRRFIGRGYVTVSLGGITKTIYASYANNDIANNTRTVSFIANSLKNDTAAYNALSDKSVVDYFANAYNPSDEF